jgi:hypothetical protein
LQCGNMKPALLGSSAAIDDAFHVNNANKVHINVRMRSALKQCGRPVPTFAIQMSESDRQEIHM